MSIRRAALILIPYDSGQPDARMGLGPHRLAPPLRQRLLDAGIDVAVEEVRAEAGFPLEVRDSFELQRRASERVRAARRDERFPILLSGNCNTAAVACLAALGARTDVFWFDAHGDFNTPETTRSGFLDGMAVAIVAGRCWRLLSTTVPGFAPLPEERITLIGTRDLDPAEEALLASAAVARVSAQDVRRAGAAALDDVLARRAAPRPNSTAYLHIDLDVLDPHVAVANPYAAGGGLTLEQAETLVRAIRERTRIAALSLTAYDPASDAESRVPRAAAALLGAALL